MDQKKLRETLGFFSTGVIIACARRRNFLAETFFSERVFSKKESSLLLRGKEDQRESLLDLNGLSLISIGDAGKELISKFEDFWQNFLQGNTLLQKREKKVPTQNFLEKIKKVFVAEFFGMTINSFTSVSLDPPFVSFCIYNRSTNLKFFKKNRYFSLNVLSESQQDLARAFATPKNSTKWEVEPYFFGKKGNPIFQKSLAFFECRKHRVIKCGDHHIVIGEVVDFGKINESKPLIFYRGKFES